MASSSIPQGILRVVGDVHAQILPEDVLRRAGRSYLQIIADAPYSVQVGDLGDGEAYAQLVAHVDASRHRFFPGNHDHYDQLPPHNLGDFGVVAWGGVEFFFVRGAASTDRDTLVRRGRELGKTLWFEQEELSYEALSAAELTYRSTCPQIVISHDAPSEIARHAWQHARQFRPRDPRETFQPSRTNEFLTRLRDFHPPRLWIFGHHHRDWRYREGETLFVCVGELSYVDINQVGAVVGP